MNLSISKEAAHWYEQEYEVSEATDLRIYVRYGGVGGLIPGFSIGLNIEKALSSDVYVKVQVNHIQFYIIDSDAWYFENHDLHVGFDDNLSEPKFIYTKKED